MKHTVYEKIVEHAELSAEAEYDERFNVLSTAYQLGDAAALVPLLKRGETIACVRCGGNGEDPEHRRKIADPASPPGSGRFIPGPTPTKCSLCDGSGIITRGEIRALLKDQKR